MIRNRWIALLLALCLGLMPCLSFAEAAAEAAEPAAETEAPFTETAEAAAAAPVSTEDAFYQSLQEMTGRFAEAGQAYTLTVSSGQYQGTLRIQPLADGADLQLTLPGNGSYHAQLLLYDGVYFSQGSIALHLPWSELPRLAEIYGIDLSRLSAALSDPSGPLSQLKLLIGGNFSLESDGSGWQLTLDPGAVTSRISNWLYILSNDPDARQQLISLASSFYPGLDQRTAGAFLNRLQTRWQRMLMPLQRDGLLDVRLTAGGTSYHGATSIQAKLDHTTDGQSVSAVFNYDVRQREGSGVLLLPNDPCVVNLGLQNREGNTAAKADWQTRYGLNTLTLNAVTARNFESVILKYQAPPEESEKSFGATLTRRMAAGGMHLDFTLSGDRTGAFAEMDVTDHGMSLHAAGSPGGLNLELQEMDGAIRRGDLHLFRNRRGMALDMLTAIYEPHSLTLFLRGDMITLRNEFHSGGHSVLTLSSRRGQNYTLDTEILSQKNGIAWTLAGNGEILANASLVSEAAEAPAFIGSGSCMTLTAELLAQYLNLPRP